MKKQSYFIELSVSPTGFFEHLYFPAGIVFADNKKKAEKIMLDKYTKVIQPTLKENGFIKINCSWESSTPTIKAVKEVANELVNGTIMRIFRGKGFPYRDVNAYDTISDVIEDAKRININWGEVYYSHKHDGYVVEMHPYMRLPVIVKVFEGNTHEVYQSTLEWIKNNSMKRNYFRKLKK